MTCLRPRLKSVAETGLQPRVLLPNPGTLLCHSENKSLNLPSCWVLHADSYANLSGCINGSWLLIKSCLKVKYCWQT